ncbi:halocin C8-like domain-containing protein [Halobaculum sp. MBLA0143]|uniref:halocin C8-like domain-containing protein n=1 Tax=Halobaculum sp. MBLA0143 TaxID=3079933 RepID=UPI0035246FF0
MEDKDTDDGVQRRDVLRGIGGTTAAAAFGSGVLSDTAAASDGLPDGFELTELTGEAARRAVDGLARTREFRRLRTAVQDAGARLDRSAAVVYRASYEGRSRTLASVPTATDEDHRMVVGRNDDGTVVMGALERRQETADGAEITYRELPSLASESELSTADATTDDDGLVSRTVTVSSETDGTVSTDVTEDDVSTSGVYCFNCKLLVALVCDVGCAAGTAFICGLAGTVTSAIGISACIFITGRICYVIAAAGCFLNASEICCRAGNWCC